MKIAGHDYPVTGMVQTGEYGDVPLVDIPMMSDYRWMQTSLQSRLKNPEIYRKVLGEDVEAVVEELKAWLEEHKEEASA